MTLTKDGLGPRHASQATNISSVYHHELVTSSPAALQFDAAASLQLCRGRGSGLSAPLDSRLIVSPYNDDTHLLDLTTLDIPNQLLAKALTVLKPTRPDYATAEYSSSFNWPVVLEVLRQLAAEAGYQWAEQSFYVVTFRSRLSPSADSSRLHDLDYHSLAEATSSGGLLKYWFGAKDKRLENLATCVWRNREDARRGGPWHLKARMEAGRLYESIRFSTLRWTIGDNAKASEMVPWDN